MLNIIGQKVEKVYTYLILINFLVISFFPLLFFVNNIYYILLKKVLQNILLKKVLQNNYTFKKVLQNIIKIKKV